MGRIELHGHGKDSFGIAILKSGIMKSLGFKNSLSGQLNIKESNFKTPARPVQDIRI